MPADAQPADEWADAMLGVCAASLERAARPWLRLALLVALGALALLAANTAMIARLVIARSA